MGKKHLIFMTIIVLSVIILGLYLYYCTELPYYESFSTFNNYFLSIATTIVLGYIAYLGHTSIRKFNDLQLKPILFGYTAKTNFWNNKEQSTWHLKNASSYPAMNILVSYSIYGEYFSKSISCGCLSGHDTMELFFIPGSNIIRIYFTDLTASKYYRVTINEFINTQEEISKSEYYMVINDSSINILAIKDEFIRNPIYNDIRSFQLLYLVENISHKKDSHMMSYVNNDSTSKTNKSQNIE